MPGCNVARRGMPEYWWGFQNGKLKSRTFLTHRKRGGIKKGAKSRSANTEPDPKTRQKKKQEIVKIAEDAATS